MEMVTIRVNVSKSDIKNGERNNCRKCPVALALSRKVKIPPEEQQLRVYQWHVIMPKFWTKLPMRVKQFIQNFDRQEFPEKPFSFRIKVPQCYVK